MIELSEILAKIKERRKELNFKQKDVAEHLGITQSSYSSIESGNVTMSVIQFLQICDFLKINLSEKEKESSEKPMIVVNENTIVDNNLNINALSNEIDNLKLALEDKTQSINNSLERIYHLILSMKNESKD